MTINRSTRDAGYRIFLLTFWLEDDADSTDPETWRFRLEDPNSGMRLGCVGVVKLVGLLVDEIADESISQEDPPTSIK